MQLYQLTLDLLNRKYDLVVDAPEDVSLLHIIDFLCFIKSDSLIQTHTLALIGKFLRQSEQNQSLSQPIVNELKSLKDDLITYKPSLDDQCLDRPDLPELQYLMSFRRFNDILAGDDLMARGQPLEAGELYKDNTPVGRLIDIFASKLLPVIKEYENLSQQPDLENIHVRFFKLKEGRTRLWRETINYHRVSPEAALNELLRMERMINPKLLQVSSLGDLKCAIWLMDDGGTFGEELRDEIYEKQQINVERIQRTKWFVRRVYEELRARIGSTLSHQQLVGRYKARAMWYDKERLRQLTMKDGKFIRQREKTLVLEMAKWLFDNGLPVLVGTKFANLETDLLSTNLPSILIEGKAYIKASKDVVRNIAQLHAYLNNLDTTPFHIEEAYYVVFRLGGPIYDFPKSIEFNRFVIYPILIDLGSSKESGRKQIQTNVVEKDDIMEMINKGSKKPKSV